MEKNQALVEKYLTQNEELKDSLDRIKRINDELERPN